MSDAFKSKEYTEELLGAKYKRHGAIAAPLFRRGKLIPSFDSILNSTDKLLDNWRAFSNDHVHLDILERCQNLLLQIFGLIAFDCDFEAQNETGGNEFTKALRTVIDAMAASFFLPRCLLRISLKLTRQYQRDRATIEQYFHHMIEKELNETVDVKVQRKKTWLIAALVASLQVDEVVEMRKSEEDRKGEIDARGIDSL